MNRLSHLRCLFVCLALGGCAADVGGAIEDQAKAGGDFATSSWQIRVVEILAVEKDGEALSLDSWSRTFENATLSRKHLVRLSNRDGFNEVMSRGSGTKPDLSSDSCVFGGELEGSFTGPEGPLHAFSYELAVNRNEWLGDRRDFCTLGLTQDLLEQGTFDVKVECGEYRWEEGTTGIIYPGLPSRYVLTDTIHYTLRVEALRTECALPTLSLAGIVTVIEDEVTGTERRFEGGGFIESVADPLLWESLADFGVGSRLTWEPRPGSRPTNGRRLDFEQGAVTLLPGAYVFRAIVDDAYDGGRATVERIIELTGGEPRLIQVITQVPETGSIDLR